MNLCRVLIAGFALAALVVAFERAHAAPPCTTVSEIKQKVIDKLGKNGKFIEATPGQFHFLQGFYVANPSTPSGLPPGNGAMLYVAKDDSGDILWLSSGNLVCSVLPVPASMGKLMSYLESVHTGKMSTTGEEL